jgi:3,4-dihydroxy 2-butanone 4-phosphate synthase/GTP cyclohydrolase II
VKGDVSGTEPVLVRMHAVDLLDDMTGGPHWIAMPNAMRAIDRAGRGVVVLIREHRPSALAERVAQLTQNQGTHGELRDYGIGAQILLDLGVSNMILMSNRKRTIVGLDGYGLNVIEQRAIDASVEEVSGNEAGTP